MKLLTDNLYEPVLIEPAKIDGANTLKIVSGYASDTMASRHLNNLKEVNPKINIQLLIGMAKNDGIASNTHRGFLEICKKFDNFNCYYSIHNTPIHAKVYTWCRNDSPLLCYTGSANYTQNGFRKNLQSEAMTQTDAKSGLEFFGKCYANAVECTDEPVVEEHINIYKKDKDQTKKGELENHTLSLLDKKTKETHTTAGLNWGQREKRDPNQAYIPVPSNIAKTNFFPEKAEHFRIITDDEFFFSAVRAQDGSKAIHSSDDNSIIGDYFRKRLGVPSGARVTRKHLEDYGRTDVTFTKIDEETYLMDFSPKRDGAERETD